MFSIVTLLVALRLGTFSAPESAVPAAAISIRDEARTVVNERLLSPAPALDGSGTWGAGPQSPEWPSLAPSAPAQSSVAAAPVFRSPKPEAFVALVIDKLHLGEYRVGQAAMWLLSSPVRVDVSPRHVFVSVRVRGF